MGSSQTKESKDSKVLAAIYGSSSAQNPIIQKFLRNQGKDRFIKIKKFNSEISKLIMYCINNEILYFKDLGTIVAGGTYNTFIFKGFNSVTNINSNDNVSTYIDNNSKVIKESDIQQFFSSRNWGKYLLYTRDQNTPEFYLLYNPIPRKEFIDYMNDNLTDAFQQLSKYCQENPYEVVAKFIKDGTSNPPHYCLDNYIGVDRRLAIYNTINSDPLNRQAYDELARRCMCINPSVEKNHPLYQKFLDAQGLNCNSTTQICVNVANFMNLGKGTLKTGDVNLNQSCLMNANNSGANQPDPNELKKLVDAANQETKDALAKASQDQQAKIDADKAELAKAQAEQKKLLMYIGIGFGIFMLLMIIVIIVVVTSNGSDSYDMDMPMYMPMDQQQMQMMPMDQQQMQMMPMNMPMDQQQQM